MRTQYQWICRKMSNFQFEAENIKTCLKLHLYISFWQKTQKIMWRNIYLATMFGFPQKSRSITGLPVTGLIGQFTKIDIYGNRLNYQLGNRSRDPLPEKIS